MTTAKFVRQLTRRCLLGLQTALSITVCSRAPQRLYDCDKDHDDPTSRETLLLCVFTPASL